VALNTQSAIPGTHAALLTVDVSATRGQYWALAGWQLITLAALLALTSGVQGSSCIMNLRRLRVARNEIEHVAKHDALTGLPNRRLFHERLRAGLAAAERNGAPLAVLLLDLDRFKMINDTLGHPAGDELLQGVASRLQGLRRSGDMVARLGGDEFALLIVGLRSAEESTKLAQRIVDALAEPFTLQGRTITSAASVGIAISPDDGADPDELLAKADMALYRAKAGGRSRAERFAPAMQATVEDDRRVEEELRTALSNNQFGLLYQPQIDLVTGAVVGVEALLRWHHADRGLLAPGDFLRVAEETGLMPEIGGLVLDHACSQLRCWLDDGIDIGRLAVNLSPAQMSGPSLVENVLDRLRHYDLDASSMVLEITEGCVMGPRGEDVAQMLVQLRSADIGLALDDFGTGYASLRHLRTLPISQLKIDRDFVRDLMLDEDDSAIVRAMISLAHDLGLEVVAEGIEKSEQIAVLKQFGCDFGQGYAFAHPMPAADMVAFVRTRMPPRLAVVESGYAARAGSKVGPLLPFAN
ncbi:MAG: EAL domain-containing protein, partial [Pseudomonadota bacterium]